mmetsp:Transcript_4912/g.20014  ORF Transcript_4912/g.20014 Transcript_4912/m.20014 type:complete len:227 (+) Transcript_4912:461-1141(+)
MRPKRRRGCLADGPRHDGRGVVPHPAPPPVGLQDVVREHVPRVHGGDEHVLLVELASQRAGVPLEQDLAIRVPRSRVASLLPRLDAVAGEQHAVRVRAFAARGRGGRAGDVDDPGVTQRRRRRPRAFRKSRRDEAVEQHGRQVVHLRRGLEPVRGVLARAHGPGGVDQDVHLTLVLGESFRGEGPNAGEIFEVELVPHRGSANRRFGNALDRHRVQQGVQELVAGR